MPQSFTIDGAPLELLGVDELALIVPELLRLPELFKVPKNFRLPEFVIFP